MNIEQLTQVLTLLNATGNKTDSTDCASTGCASTGCESTNTGPWEVNKKYFIQTITMSYTGCLVAVNDKELVLKDVAWIADTGRFTEAMDKGTFNEVEPLPSGRNVAIGRGAIVMGMQVTFDLPKTQK